MGRAWTYLVSGAAINEKEAAQNFLSGMPVATDTEEQKRIKVASMQARMWAVRQIAAGHIDNPADAAIQALETILSRASAEGWRDKLVIQYRSELNQAKAWRERLAQTPELGAFGPQMYNPSTGEAMAPGGSGATDWNTVLESMRGSWR